MINEHKNGFTIIEVVVVFLLMLGVTFFILPRSLDSTRQATLISSWTQKYSQLQYMFSVITAQHECEINNDLKKAQTNHDRQQIVLSSIKPYLRITTELQSGDYKPRYMNKSLVRDGDTYYFPSFYKTDGDEIIGLKWINADCTNGEVCAVMAFDVNGLEPPNRWGYDLFAINLFKNRIEPLGKKADSDELRHNCSKFGFGTYCSYYYLIGGEFEN